MEIMRKHPIIGESIIRPVGTLQNLCPLVRGHHEWLNGEGYPDKLTDKQIPLGAKILAITDSFDAMTTDRPYHKGMNFKEARDELCKYKNIRYDAKIVDVFLEVLDEMYKGADNNLEQD